MAAHAKEVAGAIPQSLSPNVIKLESIAIRETSNIRGLNLPQIPATVTRKEKSLEERLITGGDKHLSWRKGRKEKTLLDVSRKQEQFVSKKWYGLLGGNAGPELLSGELFKVLLYLQVGGRVTNKESPITVTLTTNVGKYRA